MPGGYKVVSSNGATLAWVYALEDFVRSASPNTLIFPEARTIARAIARLANNFPQS